MKILLAVDGSGHSTAAVGEVAHRRLPAGSEVRIISVVDTSYYAPAFPGGGVGNVALLVEIEAAAQIRARAAVDAAAASIRAVAENPTCSVTADVLSGSAKLEILQDTEAFGADLIVVGSHGHGHFERFRLGSVSHAVALHANCSVEIVRTPRDGT